MKFICLLFFFILIRISFAQTWQQISNFPSSERDDGTNFTIGNIAYCGTGYTPWWSTCSDFYSFDMNSETWSTIPSLPNGKERQYATGFSNSAFGYILGGINGSNYLNDLWQYDPISTSWTEKTTPPFSGRSGTVNFVLINIVYIIGGRSATAIAIDEVWAYDLFNETWQQKNNLPFGSRWRASTTTLNNEGYLLFGRDENNRYCNELFKYDPILDSWSQINTFPLIGRSYASLVSLEGELIVIAGMDTLGNYYNDMWQFIPSDFSWHELNSIPSAGRKGGMYFNNSSTLFYTTGITQNNTRLKETWKCYNPASLNEISEPLNVQLYPNPASENIVLEIQNIEQTNKANYKLLNAIGQEILSADLFQKSTQINISNLSKGIYYIQYCSASSFQTIKFIKY